MLIGVCYPIKVGYGFEVSPEAGLGYAFSDYNSPIYEIGASLSKKFGGWSARLGASYRITTEEIKLAHKTIEQPDQVRWTLSLSKKF